MKFTARNEHNQKVDVNVRWSDHAPGCAACREVNIEQSITFPKACAEGSPLLMEELVRREAPNVRKNAKAVREWAEKTGVFKMK